MRRTPAGHPGPCGGAGAEGFSRDISSGPAHPGKGRAESCPRPCAQASFPRIWGASSPSPVRGGKLQQSFPGPLRPMLPEVRRRMAILQKVIDITADLPLVLKSPAAVLRGPDHRRKRAIPGQTGLKVQCDQSVHLGHRFSSAGLSAQRLSGPGSRHLLSALREGKHRTSHETGHDRRRLIPGTRISGADGVAQNPISRFEAGNGQLSESS